MTPFFEPPKIDGAEVRARRRKLPGQPSVRAFASSAGVNYVTLSHLETGRAGASPEMIAKLADALGCKPWDLCKDKTPWPKDLSRRVHSGVLYSHIAEVKRHVEMILSDESLKEMRTKNPAAAKRVEDEARYCLQRAKQMIRDIEAM